MGVMITFKINLLQICFNYCWVGATSPSSHYSSSHVCWLRESERNVGHHHQYTLILALTLGSTVVQGGSCEHHCRCLIDQLSSERSSALKGVESVEALLADANLANKRQYKGFWICHNLGSEMSFNLWKFTQRIQRLNIAYEIVLKIT